VINLKVFVESSPPVLVASKVAYDPVSHPAHHTHALRRAEELPAAAERFALGVSGVIDSLVVACMKAC